MNQYESVNYSYEDMKLYSAGAPFTELHWRFGSERLEHLVAEHGQVVKGRLAIGAKYQRSSSRGFYQHQRSGANNGYAYMMFQGKKRKYKARIEFIHNGYVSQQNGGTIELPTGTATIFDFSDIGRRETVEVNLENAQSSHRTSEYGFTHYYDLGEDVRTVENDTFNYLTYIPKWRIQHRLSYKDEYFLYADDIPGAFYSELLIDESVIRDYLHYYRWQNNVDLVYTATSVLNDSLIQSPFRFSVGLESGLHFVQQIFENNSNAQTFDLKLRLEKNPLHHSDVIASLAGQIGFGPYNAGAYYAKAIFGYRMNKQVGHLYASLQSRSQRSAYISNNYFGNIHQWQNDVPNYRRNSLGLHSENFWNMLNADVYFHRLNSYRVWDSELTPFIINANLVQSNIEATIPFGRFKLKNFVSLNITDAEELALPLIAAHHYFYLEDKMFQGALDAQVGIDLSYNTPFKALSYAPTLGQFYYDADSDFERGFTPMLGAFISLKIRSVLLMGRAEFINQGLGYLGDLESPLLGANGFYLHPNYPAQDRLFSLGVRWQFYD